MTVAVIRALRLLFLIVLGLALLVVAFANREPVALRLLPDDIAAFAGMNPAVQLPLFLVIFGGIVAGLAIGFVWEWLRGSKHRTAAARHGRTAATLQREVSRLRDKDAPPNDDVLALLEAPRAAR